MAEVVGKKKPPESNLEDQADRGTLLDLEKEEEEEEEQPLVLRSHLMSSLCFCQLF